MSDRPPLPPLSDDGRPTLPTGEPVLHRWFVIAMLVLVPIALGVSIWAATFVFGRDVIEPAERRPPGDAEVTIDRGDAELGATEETDTGPACATGIEVVGDQGARNRALEVLDTVCALLRRGGLSTAEVGLQELASGEGQLRFAVFERSGVESSLRRDDDGRLTLELNASFQFEEGARAAPAVVHQLTLLADSRFPGEPITAERALLGAEAEAIACERLVFPDEPPRGCLDVAELLEGPDPLGALVTAGYPSAAEVPDADVDSDLDGALPDGG